MAKTLVQRLLLLLAFAAAMLSPAAARAALVPACESHQITRMPVEWLAAPPAPPAPDAMDACSVAPAGAGEPDELGDTRVAAMCDGRGASVIAPPLVRAIVDARIEAGGACGLDVSAPVVGPGPEHAPLGAPGLAVAEHATLGALGLVPPASSELAPPYAAPRGGARAGVRRGIDHPPR